MTADHAMKGCSASADCIAKCFGCYAVLFSEQAIPSTIVERNRTLRANHSICGLSGIWRPSEFESTFGPLKREFDGLNDRKVGRPVALLALSDEVIE